MLLAFFLVVTSARAQDDDLMGTWQIVSTLGGDPRRCGRPLSYGELEITSKEAGEKKAVYTGNVTAWHSSQRCLDVTKDATTARLVVRGTRVSLSYGDESWNSEMLVLNGNSLAGIDADGAEVEWVKPGELPLSLNAPMVKQNIITNMNKERVGEMRAMLIEGGHDEAIVDGLVETLVTGLADCVVDVAQVQAAVQRLPYDELLKIYDPISGDQPNSRVVRRLDRTAAEARTRACFYEVGDAMDVDVFD
jgi:hypothetical protein